MVYPSAHHTRFSHAIGAMYLMNIALDTLISKGNVITQQEKQAALIAILLHDIGHGPYSHALENIILEVHHEKLSLEFMTILNDQFQGKLSMAIEIFKGDYQKKFLHQLVSSQFDMDRLDYLKRDSFNTGVIEGDINSLRLLSMLDIVEDELVIDIKGIYSVEKFIFARRFMYWQVYLHKTSTSTEVILKNIFRRAKELVKEGFDLPSDGIGFFLRNNNDKAFLDENKQNTLEAFSHIDDSDIMCLVKKWQYAEDLILSKLSSMLINRKLFKTKISSTPFDLEKIEDVKKRIGDKYGITLEQSSYFIGQIEARNTCNIKDSIKFLDENNNLINMCDVSQHYKFICNSTDEVKYILYFPKDFLPIIDIF
ncbi:phosphohydrolase [Ichthyobacterium seriolicida]|uniref:Phosphohydrolase n=2 Tax=Ichthyobacterium seriolicida TaxID=242600 RepID=A0A1J1DWP1_9FLAO|nr:phosphohydrolase [Ichthyobacterium seriolicida]